MKIWYKNLTKGQKVYIYLMSTALVLFYATGVLPLSILIYLELGERGSTE